MNKNKFIHINFEFTAALQEKTSEVEMPVNYNHIESISFVSPDFYPIIASKIKSFEIDGDGSMIESGIFVGFFQENYFSDQNNKLKNIPCKELAKIKASLQDAGAYIQNSSAPYSIQIVLEISKK